MMIKGGVRTGSRVIGNIWNYAQCSVFTVAGYVSRLALSNHPFYSGIMEN